MLSDRNFITSVQDYRVEPLHLDYTQDKVGVPKIKKSWDRRKTSTLVSVQNLNSISGIETEVYHQRAKKIWTQDEKMRMLPIFFSAPSKTKYL